MVRSEWPAQRLWFTRGGRLSVFGSLRKAGSAFLVLSAQVAHRARFPHGGSAHLSWFSRRERLLRLGSLD
jgi:hypothetical protein